MFVTIQNDIVNVNHIVSCATGSGVTLIVLTNGRRLTIPASDFEANVLPLLPMLKPTQDIVILPPAEVQVEVPIERTNPVVDPQEAKPKSSRKSP